MDIFPISYTQRTLYPSFALANIIAISMIMKYSGNVFFAVSQRSFEPKHYANQASIDLIPTFTRDESQLEDMTSSKDWHIVFTFLKLFFLWPYTGRSISSHLLSGEIFRS